MADPLPQKIGKYEVRGALGEGGFGRVYLAFDPTVGRPVAVKVLTAQGTPDMLARFQNEATAAGNLHHENIVTIYEFGVYDGAPYIAMEYLEGHDLHQVMVSGQSLTLLDKVRIMTQVGQGLQCAHDHGVVHRDVKPANIKVLPNRSVKMMDFGIARLTNDDSTRLTHKGDLIGTIRYMSPEQFQGLDVDALCDIFAYGVIFYELVAGVHPFEAPNVGAFMTRISETRPAAPLSQMVPGCPPTLHEIVMRAIEKDRELRYQSLEDLLLDMRPLLLELQRERAAELFALAHDLFASGQLARAQAFIKEIIDLDSSNPEVWELRERIQQSSHRMSVRPKVDALLKTADSDLGRRLFPEAIESLEAAAKLDPADPEIAAKLSEARQQQEAAERAAQFLLDADREFSRQNLTLAERFATQALTLDPQNRKAAELVETVRRDLEQRDNERRLRLILEDARRLAAVEDFDAAIEKLSGEGQNLRDPSAQIPALLGHIRAEKIKRERQERLRSEKQSLRGILKESRFADAVARLEALCADFPEDRDLASLLADARNQFTSQQRDEDIRAAKAEAAVHTAASHYSEAEDVLRRLADVYPADAEIRFLVQAAAHVREDHERRQNLADLLLRVQQLRTDGRFEDAKQALDRAQKDFGDEASFREERKTLDAEWSAWRRAAQVRQTLASARAIISEGHYDSAMSLLKQAAAEDPRNPEVEDLLLEARNLVELQRASRAIDQACAQARELTAAHDFDAAAALLRRVLQNYPGDPRLEGLLDAVSAQKLEWDSAQRLREAVRSCSQLLRDRRYPEAIHALELHLENTPGEPALLKLLNQAKADWEASKRTDALGRAMAEVRSAMEQNRLDEAAVLIEHYTGEFGAAPEFIALRNQVETMLRQAERNRQIEEVKEQVLGWWNQRNWEAALQVCQAAMKRIPDAPELLELFGAIQQQIARERRASEVARLGALARQAIALTDWNAASGRIEELGRQFPDEPSLSVLRESLKSERRRIEGEQAFASLDEAFHRGDWALAEKRLAAAAAILPDSPRLAEDRSRIERGKRRERAVGEARNALKKGRFDEAERLLAPIVSEDPNYADASVVLQQARSQRAAAEAEQAIKVGRKQAKSLIKERKFEAAAGVLQDLINRYGPQGELESDLAQARAAAQPPAPPQPPAPSLNDVVGRLKSLVDRGDMDGAAAALNEGLKAFPNEAALLEWKQRLVEEKKRRDTTPPIEPRQDEPTDAGRPFWKRPLVIAAVLIALVVVIKFVLFPSAPPLTVEATPLAAGRAGEFYSISAKASGGAPPYQWTVSNGELPAGLTLGPASGSISGTPTVQGKFDFSIRASDRKGRTAETSLNLSIEPKKEAVVTEPPAKDANPPLPTLDAVGSPPEGKVGERYEFRVIASGGVPPYQWSLVSKAPPGLSLNDGTLSGIPTADGPYIVRVRVTDQAGKTAERLLAIAIRRKDAPVAPLQILTSALPEGKVKDSYTATLRASGGKPGYQWSVARGQLPAGLLLDSASGTIRGTPSVEARSSLTFRMTDGEGQSRESTLTLLVLPESKVAQPASLCPSATGTLSEGEYSGKLTGSIEWKGAAGTAPVVIVSRTPIKGGGRVSPDSPPLQGAPLIITPHDARVIEPPSKQNGWRCIAFQPAADSVRIDWKVDWTLNQR